MYGSVANWLLVVPIWCIGVGLFIGMVACAWLGYAIRKRHDRTDTGKAKDGEKEESQEGLVLTAVMGLLALLVGFTFSLALDRYDTRRTSVLEESNAIGTTYLRTQLLESPYRERMSQLLVAYTDNRIALADARPGPDAKALLERNDQLVAALWTETVTLFPSIRGYDFSSSFLDTMNLVIDMDAARQAAQRAHVPPEVFLLLIIYQFMTAIVLGYVLTGSRGRASAAFLFALFGLSLMLVIDIDRATAGGLRVPQQPMRDLREMMRAHPPESYGGMTTPAPTPAPPR